MTLNQLFDDIKPTLQDDEKTLELLRHLSQLDQADERAR